MAVSLLAIAQSTGLSRATISRALRGSPLVHAKTRAQVEQSARKLGYVPTPLVGAVMASLRRASHAVFAGNLAVVFVPGRIVPTMTSFLDDVVAGAKQRALALGFGLELFDLSKKPLPPPALARILRARGVLGAIFIHQQRTHELDGFAWDYFPSVEIDHSLAEPALHTVCIEHHESFVQAMERLAGYGYRRAGLFIEQHKDERLRFKWSAAFRSHQETRGSLGHVPILAATAIDRPAFITWFNEHRPDLVIGHKDEAIAWLRNQKRRVPRDVGFFNLNWNDRTRPCAGLDLRPTLQGEVAVEAVVAQVHRHERGAPVDPRTTMVNARWADGPTIKLCRSGFTPR